MKTVLCMANTLPWNELVLRGERTFKTFHQNLKYRGKVLLYNSQRFDEDIEDICDDYGVFTAEEAKTFPKGVIVGYAEICGVIHQDESLSGLFELELRNPKRFKKPIPYKPTRGSIRLSKAPASLLRRATV